MGRKVLTIALALLLGATLMVLAVAAPAWASPPYPGDGDEPVGKPELRDRSLQPSKGKLIDQPNLKDYQRLQERMRLLEAGKVAEANALAQEGEDRVLVILVEFAGTDVYTWTVPSNPMSPTIRTGSTWDPLGIADPDEDTGVVGDCSVIQQKIEASRGYSLTEGDVLTFTYQGPMHNRIPTPLSLDDRSGNSIFTTDFSNEWFEEFMFGNGVVISYTMQDGTPIYESFEGQSVRDYYLDMSSGAYTITGDVVGWLGLPHSTWYYDADECPGARSGPGTVNRDVDEGVLDGTSKILVRDALDAVDAISNTIPGFDWANYDLNGDGILDRLWIVHAGYGTEDSTTLLNRVPLTGTNGTVDTTFYGEASVWSHSSQVTPPYSVTQDIAASPYIIMPENGGIGVFAHEYGHNLGAIDHYAYGFGDTSAGFWTLMADDWTGYPIGFEPPAIDAWHLDRWGWLNPLVITDTSQTYEFTLGQASRFETTGAEYRGAKIELPDGVLDLAAPIWQGDYYWWGGKENLANAMMTTQAPIEVTEGMTLSFDLAYDIEGGGWDFLWVQVSEDGSTWETLTNENTQCETDPAWIGPLYGFPDDLCGAGLGGFYGHNPSWPAPDTQVFDLSTYAGSDVHLRFWYMTDWATTGFGPFVDNVEMGSFSDDAESGDANWDYAAPWQRSDGTQAFDHNFYLQWRNVDTETGGYDSALGEELWRFGPANTGLLMWYNNNHYSDNEIFNYLEDNYSYGPKGRVLVVDSHPEPYVNPYVAPHGGLGAENANLTSRGLMRDAPFSLQDTVDFTYTQNMTPTLFNGRPAVSSFHDALGYYPGFNGPWDFGFYNTVDWDASAAIPARDSYSTKTPSGTDIPSFGSVQYVQDVGWYYANLQAVEGGTGNPGDDLAQYGWHVEILDQTDMTATVRVWNSMKELDASLEVDNTSAEVGDTLSYSCSITQNIGSKLEPAYAVIPLDTTKVEYVPGSVFGGAVAVAGDFSVDELADVYRDGGAEGLRQLSASSGHEIGAIVWISDLETGEGADAFGFSVRTKSAGSVEMAASFYEGEQVFQTEEAASVSVMAEVFLPLLSKAYTPPATFTILHTNDFHGRLETDYKGRGGSAYMASVIEDVREEVGSDDVLLMDAGDAYLAAPPISQLVLGESVIDVYNMLGYDAAAFGNHSFDKGQDVVQDRVAQSDFPWLGANIVISGTNWEHPDWVEPYVILEAGGIDVGVIGLDTDETPQVTIKGATDGLEFKDLTEAVLHYYDEVMAEADALVVLAHMGTEDSGSYKGLQTVAQELIDAGKPVDLMIGGHQHQPLFDPLMVGDTAIIEAGYYGRWLGRADVAVNVASKELSLAGYELITITDSLPADPEVETRVESWAEQVASEIEQVVGYTNVDLVRNYDDESNMGNLVTDGMRWKADQYDDGEVNGSVDIAFTNPGGLRADIEIPDGATTPYTVTWGDTFNVMPFGNMLYMMDLTGEQVRTLLDQSANLYKGILQTSGASWYWYNDCQCDTPTSWGTYTVTVGGEMLVPTQTYRIVTNDFLAGGQDGWVTFAEGTNRSNTYYDMQEGVNEYIDWYNDEVGPIDHEVEGRIVYVPE